MNYIITALGAVLLSAFCYIWYLNTKLDTCRSELELKKSEYNSLKASVERQNEEFNKIKTDVKEYKQKLAQRDIDLKKKYELPKNTPASCPLDAKTADILLERFNQ